MDESDGGALGSRYILERRIGAGGMGTVWTALTRDTGRRVAVKILREDLAGDPRLVARFVQERTALIALRHPYLVALHDMIVEADRLALVMDYVPGGDLHRHLYEQRTLPQARAAALAGQVSAALAAVHAAGIVHRDIKPANVLLDPAPGEPAARLTDFGICRITDAAAGSTTELIGTPNYLAPELIQGAPPTPAADVYALGMMLYELTAGRAPFAGSVQAAILHRHLTESPRRVPGIADPLWQVIAACTAKDPRARPDAAALVRTLADAVPDLAHAPRLEPAEDIPGPAADAPPSPVRRTTPELAPGATMFVPDPRRRQAGADEPTTGVRPPPAEPGRARRRPALLIGGAIGVLAVATAAGAVALTAGGNSGGPATASHTTAGGADALGAAGNASGAASTTTGTAPGTATTPGATATTTARAGGTTAATGSTTGAGAGPGGGGTTATATTGSGTMTTTKAAAPNPYAASQVCGSGYSTIDSHNLGSATVYLMYSGSSGDNCVTTMAHLVSGAVSMSAALAVEGGASGGDSGTFTYYAGPVREHAPKTCVRWGGSYAGTSWTSGWSHCS